MKLAYLDASAFLKLVILEPESTALRAWLGHRPWTSATLLRVEAERAARRFSTRAGDAVERSLSRRELIRMSNRVLAPAGAIQPPGLRALDAIHLATALHLGDNLTWLVTYDRRMADAARSLGLKVATPV